MHHIIILLSFVFIVILHEASSYDTTFLSHRHRGIVCQNSGKDPPTLIVDEPWVHAGRKSSVALNCFFCTNKRMKHPIWWKKDGELLTKFDGRIHKLFHRRNDVTLKIKNVATGDFGVYTCGVNTTQHGVIEKDIELSGVPYPPVLDIPVQWTETSFNFSWRVNCSTPIIHYQLEFKKTDPDQYGQDPQWVSLNIPGEAEIGIGRGRHVRVHEQSYTLKGLTKEKNYQVRVRANNAYGFSGYSETMDFRTGSNLEQRDLKKQTSKEEERIPNYSSESDDKRFDPVQQQNEEKQPKEVAPKNVNDVANSEPLSTRQTQGFASTSSTLSQPIAAFVCLITITVWFYKH